MPRRKVNSNEQVRKLMKYSEQDLQSALQEFRANRRDDAPFDCYSSLWLKAIVFK